MYHDDSKILVANKPVEAYVHAALVSLRRVKTVEVEGLGRQSGKVLAVAKLLSDTCRARILDIQSFEKDGVQGIRAFLERLEEGKASPC